MCSIINSVCCNHLLIFSKVYIIIVADTIAVPGSHNQDDIQT